MVTLYRKTDCPLCDEIEELFSEIVLAYRVGNNELLPKKQSKKIPIITDGQKLFFGERAIREYLQETKKVMAQWQKFQSDSCYLDDDGKVC